MTIADDHPIDRFVKDHIEALLELGDDLNQREGRIVIVPIPDTENVLIVNVAKQHNPAPQGNPEPTG